MQSLLNALRSSGATQPALVAGMNWAGDLSQWLAWHPSDPAAQLAASAHIYSFSQCNTASCWSSQIAAVAAQVPVVTGELGETDCAHAFVDGYMSWADGVGISYLGWSWNTASCGAGPALVASYDGTPTGFGVGLRDHLAKLAATAPPTTTTTSTSTSTTTTPTTVAPSTTTTTSTSTTTTTTPTTVAATQPSGGVVLDIGGGLHPFAVGSSPASSVTSGTVPGPARGVVRLAGGKGGYVLDGYGNLAAFSVAGSATPARAVPSTTWTNWDIARGLVLLPSGTGGYVLDGWGGLHPFAVGGNPMPPQATVSAYWTNWDIARGLVLLGTGTGGYVADSCGGVHPFSLGSASMPPQASGAPSLWCGSGRGLTLLAG